MVEFGVQRALALFRSFALCDVDVDAHHALRVTITIVRDEAARLDPPHSTVQENNAVLHIVFAPPLTECMTAKSFQAPHIIWVHPILPLTARRLGCPLGQSVDG